MILDCGLIELVQNVVTMRSVIVNCYEAIGIAVSKSTLQGLICSKHIIYIQLYFKKKMYHLIFFILDVKDSLEKKRSIFINKSIPNHPPVFRNWYLKEFPSPGEWLVVTH